MFTEQEVKNIIIYIRQKFGKDNLDVIRNAFKAGDDAAIEREIEALRKKFDAVDVLALNQSQYATEQNLLKLLQKQGVAEFTKIAKELYAKYDETTKIIQDVEKFFLNNGNANYQTQKQAFDDAMLAFNAKDYTGFETEIEKIFLNLSYKNIRTIEELTNSKQLAEVFAEARDNTDYRKQIIDRWVFFLGDKTPLTQEDKIVKVAEDTSGDIAVNPPGDDTTGGDTGGDDKPGDDTTGGDTGGDDKPGDDTTGGDTGGDDKPGDDTTGGDTGGDDKPGDDTTGGDTGGDDTTGGDTDGGFGKTIDDLINDAKDKLLDQIEADDDRKGFNFRSALELIINQNNLQEKAKVFILNLVKSSGDPKTAETIANLLVLTAKMKYYQTTIDKALRSAGIQDKQERRFIMSALIAGWNEDPEKLKAAILDYFEKNNKDISDESIAKLEKYFKDHKDDIFSLFSNVIRDSEALNGVSETANLEFRRFVVAQVDNAILGLLSAVGIDKEKGLLYENPEGFWQHLANFFITVLMYAIDFGTQWAVSQLESKLKLNKLTTNGTRTNDTRKIYPFTTKQELTVLKAVEAEQVFRLAASGKLRRSKYLKLSARKFVSDKTDDRGNRTVILTNGRNSRTLFTYNKDKNEITRRDVRLNRDGSYNLQDLFGRRNFAKISGNKELNITEGNDFVYRMKKVSKNQQFIGLDELLADFDGKQVVRVEFSNDQTLYKMGKNGYEKIKTDIESNPLIQIADLRKYTVKTIDGMKITPVAGKVERNFETYADGNKYISLGNELAANIADNQYVRVRFVKGADNLYKLNGNKVILAKDFNEKIYSYKAGDLRKMMIKSNAQVQLTEVKIRKANGYFEFASTNGKTFGECFKLPKDWADNKVVRIIGWNSQSIDTDGILDRFASEKARDWTVARIKSLKIAKGNRVFIQGDNKVTYINALDNAQPLLVKARTQFIKATPNKLEKQFMAKEKTIHLAFAK